MNRLIKNLSLIVAGTGAATGISLGIAAAANSIISKHNTNSNLLPKQGLTYSWRFGNIYYEKNGQGKPILLIHDIHSMSCGYEWKEIIDELSKKHTVYTIDLLGCGRSEKPKFTYTIYLYVQLICDFIKNVIGHKTDVITSGASSSIAVLSCAFYSQYFSRLMLINPESITNSTRIPSKRDKVIKRLLDLPITGTCCFNYFHRKNHIKEIYEEQFLTENHKLSDLDIDKVSECAHLNSTSKLLYNSTQCNYTHLPIRHALQKIDQSITVVGGSEEPEIITTIDSYISLNPAIESDMVLNAKHLPQMENPQGLLELIDIHLS